MLSLSTQDSSWDISQIPGGFLVLTEFPGGSPSSRVGSPSSWVGKLPAVTLEVSTASLARSVTSYFDLICYLCKKFLVVMYNLAKQLISVGEKFLGKAGNSF